MNGLKIVFFIFIFLSQLCFSEESGQIDFDKKIVKQVKKILEKNKLNKETTCLDNYVERNEEILKKMGVPTLKGAGGGGFAGLYAGWIYGYIAAGGAAEGALAGFIGVVTGGAGLAVGVAAGTVAGLSYEGYLLYRLLKINHLIRVVVSANGKNYKSKYLARFMKKYSRKYPKDKINVRKLSSLISSIDANGKLCDGSLVRKRGIMKKYPKDKSKLKNKLARKSEIFAYIHSQL